MPILRENEPRKSKVKRAPGIHAAPPPEMVIGPTWRQVFNDDFTASHFDMRKWWTRYTHNDGYLDYLNDEQERYRESANHMMRDGKVELTAYPQGEGDVAPDQWCSGMLRSKDIYPIHNGNEWYFECRGLVPRPKGIWPAFWIASCETIPGDDASALWPPECDIMEIVNNGAEDTTWMLHCSCKVWNWDYNPQGYGIDWCTENFNPEWGTWWAPFDFADDFHTWGLWYRRPEFVLYCDRKPICSGTYNWVFDNGQICPGCYVLVNLAIGGSWAGRHGVDNAGFPCAFAVDYVRVWTRMPQSTIGHDLVSRAD